MTDSNVIAFDITKPVCIDLYHGDVVLDLQETFAAGIKYCFLKATEGLGSRDETYHSRRKLATMAGMKVGAYHFGHLQEPENEADFFLDYVDVDAALALSLDWERLRDGSYGSAQNAARFIQRVLEKTNRKRMWVYGGDVLKEAINGNDPAAVAFWSLMLLWLAQYGITFAAPQAFRKLPDLWQNNGDSYGPGPHTLPGIKGLVDNSRIVVGTLADLDAKWAG